MLKSLRSGSFYDRTKINFVIGIQIVEPFRSSSCMFMLSDNLY